MSNAFCDISKLTDLHNTEKINSYCNLHTCSSCSSVQFSSNEYFNLTALTATNSLSRTIHQVVFDRTMQI